MPAPAPAPLSTSTSWPSASRARAPSSVSATRRSAGLISLTTPMRICFVSLRLGLVGVERLGDGGGDQADLFFGGDEGRADLQRVVVDDADQHTGVRAGFGDRVAVHAFVQVDPRHEAGAGAHL